MRRLTFLFCLLLAGCASPAKRDAEAEARGYERGYQQAVREQYWLIQNQQRQPAASAPNPRQP
ncbi:MAG: hypothetical protein NDI75_14705 [Candidatus Didemnitutus sp.]|nr:hypothetical protein [Candidatus Didemnitutus sp.]